MADQPTHEWGTDAFITVEKNTKDHITLARRVVKNDRIANKKLIQLEDPGETVVEMSKLTCTLLDVLEDQGITPEMIARLTAKMARGRDHAIHRLLPLVKKEVKSEMKERKGIVIPYLDQKRASIAAGKRNPKIKGKGKGPKSSREAAANTDSAGDEIWEDAEEGDKKE